MIISQCTVTWAARVIDQLYSVVDLLFRSQISSRCFFLFLLWQFSSFHPVLVLSHSRCNQFYAQSCMYVCVLPIYLYDKFNYHFTTCISVVSSHIYISDYQFLILTLQRIWFLSWMTGSESSPSSPDIDSITPLYIFDKICYSCPYTNHVLPYLYVYASSNPAAGTT